MKLKHGMWILLLVIVLAGCRPAWSVSLAGPDSEVIINRETLQSLADFAVEHDGEQVIPLEYVFATQGFQLIDEIQVDVAGDESQQYEWASVANDAYWLDNGTLLIGSDALSSASIHVQPLAVLTEVEASITDIAPTAANALGIPDPAIATGQPLTETAADHVLLIFLDAFGYVRYTESLEDGLIPNMATLAPPLLSLTTYPPVTSVSSASLLTGTSPDVHGVDQRGIRKTEMETIFDVAANNGLDVVAVEGDALSFQVRSADFTLSGDRDGNGRTDDNVLANALAVLDEGMPDLFFVHFHGIDDAGHAYGPVTPEEETVIQFVDDAVGQILDALPPNTLVIIFADHGMHTVDEDGRHGNHGHLIERDMLIPIFIVEPE